jgi:hypothetical protein
MGKAIKKYSKSSIEEIEGASWRSMLLDSDDFNYKNIIFENLRQGTPEYEKSIFPALL